MDNFDVNVCRVGLLSTGELVFYDAFDFERSLATMSAHHKLKTNASTEEA